MPPSSVAGFSSWINKQTDAEGASKQNIARDSFEIPDCKQVDKKEGCKYPTILNKKGLLEGYRVNRQQKSLFVPLSEFEMTLILGARHG